jgi:hypothetical protein
MAEPASRAELDKLARELGVPESELGFLEEHAPDALRELRRLTSAALTRRHESRVRTLASMSRMLPVGVAAKIAENALGPALSARVAAAMPTEDAARLVGDLSPPSSSPSWRLGSTPNAPARSWPRCPPSWSPTSPAGSWPTAT